MNDEARMSNDETMTKSENRNTTADESFCYNEECENQTTARQKYFVIRGSSFLRASAFGFRHSSDSNHAH